MENKNSDLDLIGSLWLNESKNGVKYFKGKMQDENIVIFKNNKPKNENSPHFFLFKEKPESENQEVPVVATKEDDDLDSIPF